MNRIASLLLALACGLAVRTAQAALTDPAQIMNEAYINLVQGDQSLEAGRLDEALSLYSQARDYYQRLSSEFPGFEPRIIAYRKTYCDNQLADIGHRQAAPGAAPAPIPDRAPVSPAPASPPPALDPMPPPAAPPAANDRSVEVDYLKSRVDSLEAELAEADSLQDEIDRLAAANEQLTQQLAAANQSLADAQRQLAERAGGDQAVDALRAEVNAKNDQLQALQREIDSKAQLDQALNDMEAKVNDLRAQNDQLNGEIDALNAELDDAVVLADQADLRARQAEDKLAAAGSPSAPEATEAPALVAKAEPKKEPKKESKPVREAKAKPVEKEPASEAQPASPPSGLVRKPVPPLPIPEGMSAADFVRRLLQQGDNEGALSTVQLARKSAPDDMNLALIEGIALIRLQLYTDAATLLIDVAKSNPRNPEVNATLGAAMMGAGFHDEARETLLLALKLDKNLPECHYNLAQLYAFVDPVNLRLARRHYRNARDFGIPADPQLDAALK